MATHKTPSFREDLDSQIPAIKLLINLGYEYLTQEEVMLARGGKLSNVVLDGVLETQLGKINRITTKGKEHSFSETNIRAAVQALKDQTPNQGLVATNEAIFDLITLGKSFEETIDGDTKSFTLQYVDWNPETFSTNNVFHVAEEFVVEKPFSKDTLRPDIVLFVNGIPFVVIECKRRDLENATSLAIAQHLRNQQEIPRLFHFAQILLALSANDAKYGVTGSKEKFWNFWKEQTDVSETLGRLVNTKIPKEAEEKILLSRKQSANEFQPTLGLSEDRLTTEQDLAIFSLLQKERLRELVSQFLIFEKPDKKICRYQQYFAVKNTLERVTKFDENGKRNGGVVWHTQGSGKSLTMVLLAKALSHHKLISSPRIILVTDRKDLDSQIKKTFIRTGKETVQSESGTHLLELLRSPRNVVITTVINKFESVLKSSEVFSSPDIFVLVDESHRTQYGSFHNNMQRVFPKACYLGFTGTPLMKKEKNTVGKFGGFIDTYTIAQAVEDKAVVPLLYEGRHVVQDVDKEQIDKWFEQVTRSLTEEQKKDLKQKFATSNQLNKAEEKVKQVAFDISTHFESTWKHTGFKGQLTAPDKKTALKYKKYLDEFGMVTSEVIISPPDMREGTEDPTEESSDEVIRFWKKMLEQYGNEEEYNKTIIDKFKDSETPEILIVVDKLLTGFDAPKNVVLYIARSLKEHTLLQAIARVNRLYEGKEFGYIIDYFGILGELDQSLTTYAPLSGFDEKDVGQALTNVENESEKLPNKHAELWDVFAKVRNKKDVEEFEQFLADEAIRVVFYKKLSEFSNSFRIARSTNDFVLKTSKKQEDTYQKDLVFFQKLRVSVKRRYSESIDFRDYDSKIQKLLDTYVKATEPIQLTKLIDIFDKENFQKELSGLETDAAKADTVAYRTKKFIAENLEDDPVFFERFSKLLEDAIQSWKEKRISEKEYLARVLKISEDVSNRNDGFPEELQERETAKAFFGITSEVLKVVLRDSDLEKKYSVQIALAMDEMIQRHLKRDWVSDIDTAKKIANDADDFLYALKAEGVVLSSEQMDQIIQNCIAVAKRRYAR